MFIFQVKLHKYGGLIYLDSQPILISACHIQTFCHAPVTLTPDLQGTLRHCPPTQHAFPDAQWALWLLWPISTMVRLATLHLVLTHKVYITLVKA